MDGVDLLVQANADATPGTVTVLHSSSDEASAKALADERKLFGQERRDMRTQTVPFKDGLVKVVDMCGNLTTYSPAPLTTPSPA